MWSPEDLQRHGAGPARADFMLESLRLLQAQLHALGIPLVVLTAELSGDRVAKLLDFIKKHHVSHVFANIVYEADELCRDIYLLEELLGGQDDATAMRFELLHDHTVMEPGALKTKITTKRGQSMSIAAFKRYADAWLIRVAERPELLDLVDLPVPNDNEARAELRDLFQSQIPSLPKEMQFASEQDKIRIRGLWPAGHQAAADRLQTFLRTISIRNYEKNRSVPAADVMSRLSPYFVLGVLSVREAIRAAKGFTSTWKPEPKPKKKKRRCDLPKLLEWTGWKSECATWVRSTDPPRV